MEWKTNADKYIPGERLFVGKWRVGGAHYNVTKSLDEKLWCATCRLPGIKQVLGHFESAEVAKSIVEGAVMHWFNNVPSDFLNTFIAK